MTYWIANAILQKVATILYNCPSTNHQRHNELGISFAIATGKYKYHKNRIVLRQGLRSFYGFSAPLCYKRL